MHICLSAIGEEMLCYYCTGAHSGAACSSVLHPLTAPSLISLPAQATWQRLSTVCVCVSTLQQLSDVGFRGLTNHFCS